jgi:hypothetical protein
MISTAATAEAINSKIDDLLSGVSASPLHYVPFVTTSVRVLSWAKSKVYVDLDTREKQQQLVSYSSEETLVRPSVVLDPVRTDEVLPSSSSRTSINQEPRPPLRYEDTYSAGEESLVRPSVVLDPVRTDEVLPSSSSRTAINQEPRPSLRYEDTLIPPLVVSGPIYDAYEAQAIAMSELPPRVSLFSRVLSAASKSVSAVCSTVRSTTQTASNCYNTVTSIPSYTHAVLESAKNHACERVLRYIDYIETTTRELVDTGI